MKIVPPRETNHINHLNPKNHSSEFLIHLKIKFALKEKNPLNPVNPGPDGDEMKFAIKGK